jgi:3-hydroxy acid dehydrogenase/malonic semialdehyde reductase
LQLLRDLWGLEKMQKQAIVTGATSGIGRAIALSLQLEGYHVIAIGRNIQALDELKHQGIEALSLDLLDQRALAERLIGFKPQVLVNNAGIMPALGNFCDMARSDIEKTIGTNFTSAVNITHFFAPYMRENKKGHIFFTGSIAGHAPFANIALYCATKAAVSGFAQSLRLDLAPSSVRVTEIVAGRVETPMYKDILSVEARQAMYANNTAVQPEDVAAMVIAALKMPAHVNVARFDILPTDLPSPSGSIHKEK